MDGRRRRGKVGRHAVEPAAGSRLECDAGPRDELVERQATLGGGVSEPRDRSVALGIGCTKLVAYVSVPL
jgi:hypothetical protein